MMKVTDYQIDAHTGVVKIVFDDGAATVAAKKTETITDASLHQASALAISGDIKGDHYWDGASIHAVPAKPTPRHTWDWGLMAWRVTLADAMEMRVEEINTWRNAREYAPFTWSGHTFDATPDALRRLSLAAGVARDVIASGDARTVTWTLADNTTVELSAEDILAVMRAYGDGMDSAHVAARALKEAVRSAQTAEEVMAVQLPPP